MRYTNIVVILCKHYMILARKLLVEIKIPSNIINVLHPLETVFLIYF